jgi:hypothetical protein
MHGFPLLVCSLAAAHAAARMGSGTFNARSLTSSSEPYSALENLLHTKSKRLHNQIYVIVPLTVNMEI